MRRFNLAVPIVLSLALLIPVASAFSSGVSYPAASGAPSLAAPAAFVLPAPAQEKKVLTIEEYARFRSVVSTEISPDGAWVSYGYRKREADDEFLIENLEDERVFEIERGSNPQFSDDSRWVAYQIALPFEEIETLEDEGDPVPVQVELLNLETGDKIGPWDDISSFSFVDGSLALALRRRRADGSGGGGDGGRGGRGGGGGGGSDEDDSPRGTDMIIRYLAGGYEELLGSVDQFAFNKAGSHLAYTVDAADNNGNGIYLIDLATGARRGLDNDKQEYARLTWDEAGTSLAVLKGTTPEGFEQRVNTLLGFQRVVAPAEGAAIASINEFAYTGEGDDAFPEGFVISQHGNVAWSVGAGKLFFGIKEQIGEPEETDEPIADVNIFHWNDERMQTVQMAQANRDRNFTYLSALNIAGSGPGNFVKLTDDAMRTARLTRDGRWAVGTDNKPYISDWEERRDDYYRIDVATGERTLMLEGQKQTLGISPDGEHFLYWKDSQVWDWQLDTGDTVNLTAASPVNFADVQDDHTGEKSPYGVAGFSKDGESVILYHRYDVWSQPFDGSAPTNLTGGMGDGGEIRLRLVNLDEDARISYPLGGFTTEFDLAEPLLLSGFGEWTKKSGYFQLEPGAEPAPLVWDDKRFSALQKAADADRYLYTIQDFTEFPDYWVADQTLGSAADGFTAPTRITDANPFQDEYKWGHRILFEYTNDDGFRLQGTLAIPDDYVEGEKRPMIVRFYERYSQDLHAYPMPAYRHQPNFAGYVSAGYLLMMPDVHFRGRTSHSDMLECVEAATQKVIDMGYVDPAAIGVSGHSYSGGGTSYIAGRSDMFAAVASGAAPINLTSEFNQLFLGNGANNHSYDIYGQGRYGTNPYDDPELYVQESPITYAPEMDTALLYLHGEEDMTVGYVQGMEWYNALRFNKKNIIFLSYPGEGHGLRQYENQLDFQLRLRQFFNHYLRDMEAPGWMTEGVTYLEKERNLKRRKKK